MFCIEREFLYIWFIMLLRVVFIGYVFNVKILVIVLLFFIFICRDNFY